MTARTVLVTGGRGFLGGHLVPQLTNRGWDVLVPQPSELNLLRPAAVRRYLAERRPAALIHLAWVTTPADYWTSAANWEWSEASLRLAEEFAAAGGHRMVAAGSCAEYEWANAACSESSTPLRPASVYGAAKLELFHSLTDLARRSQLSYAWPRLFYLYGPGERPQRLVPTVLARLLAEEPPAVRVGDERRDLLHVADAAAAIAALLESDFDGPVNVASGEATRLSDVVRELARLTGYAGPLELNGDPGAAPLVLGDVSLIRQELGWRPLLSLAAGLAETTVWWRQRLAQEQRSPI